LLCACSDEEAPGAHPSQTVVEKTVVVVLPMQNGLQPHWEKVFTLFSANLQRAFSAQPQAVKLHFEFHDEDTEDLAALATSLVARDDVYAVIGGLYSANAKTLASTLCRSEVTFLTLATTEELVRAYSSTGQIWAMTETDITQCEVLLSKVVNYGGNSVALIANGEDLYGKTFLDWFGFQARELGLTAKGLFEYDAANLADVAKRAAQSEADYVVCAPSAVDDIGVVLRAFASTPHAPRLLFSDMSYGADVIARLGAEVEGLEGVCFGADPETGFDVSFQTFFGTEPTVGAAQAYDAALLLAYADWYQTFHPDVSLRDALRQIVSGRDFNMGSWTAEDMMQAVSALAQGGSPYVRGASGSLDFDSRVFTNVLCTVYYTYKIYNGRYIVLDYNTADGGNRTDATLAGWNWKASHGQDFDDVADADYAPHTRTKALLVAASSSWTNYRHQADVLSIYQLLKQGGFTDDDILLVMADDIARNPQNPEPGVVRTSPAGENLYSDVHTDYLLSQLSAADICNILAGRATAATPQVLHGDENTNLFVFWSGHGAAGLLNWGESEIISASTLQKALDTRANDGSYRKLCMFTEACFSGSLFDAYAGQPGMLFFTAAGMDETSKTDSFNADLGVWMTNRFTASFVEAVRSDPAISFSELYSRLFINTVGSHVMVYNATQFGNMHRNSIREFIAEPAREAEQ
ncbi:MAG: C13 family peptidase, partial [Alloprevotella sp.]|nr:C13 family peptidase [Alloprevotella sp.]